VNTSACHNGQKITGQLTNANITRATHSSYSPDLSPCGFWLFAFLKESMKSMELTTESYIVEAIPRIRPGATFETLQSVFQEWNPNLGH
jgi:hypothetical protein